MEQSLGEREATDPQEMKDRPSECSTRILRSSRTAWRLKGLDEMRYYKQFHTWPYGHLIALLFGFVCLSLIFVWKDPSIQIGMLACAVFALIAAWILWTSRRHYLNIDEESIVHNGFKRWKLKKTDLERVEHGRKGFMEDHDLYLKVHALGQEYDVDDGFLINEERVEALTKAMQLRTDRFRS
jgi:hypothetical protein